MSFRTKIFTLCIGLLSFISFSGNAEVIFSDSFESGDMSTTNPDGFTWGKNNRTSIVTQHPTDGPVGLYNNGAVYNPHSSTMPDGSLRDWTAKDGQNSLRFRYAPLQEWTEQRFDLGAGYPELWFSYHIRVPLNYTRGPDGPAGGRNNKWMVLLMKDMSGYTESNITRIIISDWPSADSKSIQLSSQARLGTNGGFTSNTPYYSDFVTPADAGRWMQIIYHMKASSAVGANDGSFKVYRKWEDENRFTLINSLEGIPLDVTPASINAGYNGWGGGYFLGYANDPYAEETEWLVDDIIISTKSLLPNPPKPPTILNP
jgi:hypothetical protein